MKTIARTTFTTIKTEGGILPADLLQRITEGRDLEGLRPEDYHLFAGERLNEAINRAWNRCLGAWQAFDAQRARLPESDRGTRLTRERWLLVLFQELGYGRLQYAGSLPLHAHEPESLAYPISHVWGGMPIHLVSFRQDLDRRPQTADRDASPVGSRSSAIGGQTFSGRSPHSLMQEFLNRSDDYLWGIVSNGLRLRVLRDNVSLTRAAFVEFDLEALFTGEHYADFTALWLLCHQSRVENGDPSHFWLERWSQTAAEQGVRALDALRDGVQEAIAALGRGFLAHRANAALRVRLKSGTLSTQDYYRQLLRVVYRLIFLLVAEERELLLVEDDPGDEVTRWQGDKVTDSPGHPVTPSPGHQVAASSRRLVMQYYSISRLRDLAATLRGGPHADLYRGVRLLFTLLREGYAPLGLPGLGSFLFSAEATPDLDAVELANGDLLAAIRALTLTTEGNVRRAVDYRNLGSEELGSVYESLLELHPQLNVDAGTFTLALAAGSERKTTGSYYTPSSLIQALLDTALEPVIHDKVTRWQGDKVTSSPPHPVTPSPGHQVTPSREATLLSIKVVDPACGSGHFLIAAAHRLAHHLAQIRTGDAEPAPADLRAALRDVVRHCIHGVDLNPMAVELCKVALWMETLDPGKPLSFLERNLQCGNSLFGATPALLHRGIPDEAFEPLTGDDKEVCREARKKNKAERSGQLSLFQPDLQPWQQLGNLAEALQDLEAPEETLEDVRRKEERYADLVRSAGYRFGQLRADAWCAAFVWPKDKATPYALTEESYRRLERNPYDVPKWMGEMIADLRERYAFFHWHLAYPDVFTPKSREALEATPEDVMGWDGGFDVVLGNPPWERIKLQEKEFFAERAPEIAGARTAAERGRLIQALPKSDPLLWQVYQDALRDSEAQSHFLRASGRYPQSAVGDINTYQVFAGLVRQLRGARGRVGVVLPTGIATDYYNKDYFGALVEGRELASLYDFENAAPLFPGVHRSYKFCLLTLTGPEAPADAADFAFFLHQPEQLRDPERRFALTASDFRRINPNTQTCPIFRTRRDAELTRAIYARVPVLVNETTGENPWGVSFLRMFDMTNDSGLFRTQEQLEAEGFTLHGNRFTRWDEVYLPLYEAKMIEPYDHRYAGVIHYPDRVRTGEPEETTLEQHQNPNFCPMFRYWVSKKETLSDFVESGGFLVYKDITTASSERTFKTAIIPFAAVANSAPLINCSSPINIEQTQCLLGDFNSFVIDYMSRQKVGYLHINFFILKQLPVLPPSTYDQPCPWIAAVGGPPPAVTYAAFILPRVLELTYTAWDLLPFAQDVYRESVTLSPPHPVTPPPFVWNEERRFLLRCELDAAYFHLYGIAREDVDYIMETFPIVKRKDEAAYGEYRTKRVILEMYDEMGGTTADGGPQTADGEIASGGGRSSAVGGRVFDGGRSSAVGGRYYHTRLDPPPADPRVAHTGEPPEYLVQREGTGRTAQATLPKAKPKAPPEPQPAKPAPGPTRKAAPPHLAKPQPKVVPAPETKLAPAQAVQGRAPVAPPPQESAATPTWGAGQTPLERLTRVQALSEQHTREAIAELCVALTDSESSVRHAAGAALARLGGPHVVETLLALLRHRIPKPAALEAVRILGQLRDVRARPVLEALATKAQDAELGAAARTAVDRIPKP